MLSGSVLLRISMATFLAAATTLMGQTIASTAVFPFSGAGPVIRSQTESLKPFTVAGERGVVLGQQDGTFEAWVLPVKVLSHMTIEAEVEGNKTKNWSCRCPQTGLQ